MWEERDFVSKVEELDSVEELPFEPTPGFGRYRSFLKHAIAHPAKANTQLLEFLILNFTEPGETVLDPMAGTGSTGVVAALHGRNAVQVELERKFYGWMEEARRRVEDLPTFVPKGKITNILGDTRQLSKLLSQADTNPENTGNLPFVDVVITSPPYESSLEGTTRHTSGGIASRDPAFRVDPHATVTSNSLPMGYSPNPENIGNLKSSEEEYEALEKGQVESEKTTYLSEMLKVYQEMWKVLKPNGLAAIIVKPFVRNKKVVDLPYYTCLLMERVGFKLERVYKLRLKQDSFWRILYRRKYPEVPQIRHEWVLVARKYIVSLSEPL